MGQDEYDGEPRRDQGCRRPRARRCLLKGCERWFEPARAQSRYCSAGCRELARRWRRWRASRRWRSSERGKECRRCQSRRYRERVRERSPSAQLAREGQEGEREGQRAGGQTEAFPCSRPGCYELIHRCCRSPLQKYCTSLCRQALRRVRQREGRWRRRWLSVRSRRDRGPP